MADYGDAVLTRHDDGRITVDRADPVIGITVELLAQADPAALRVTSEGHLSMGSDGLTLYRPVRFDPASGTRVLICERVDTGGLAAIPILEATVIRPGDHLIVRVEANLYQDEAAEIKHRIKERMPLLADVTVVRANGLYVFREGRVVGSAAHDTTSGNVARSTGDGLGDVGDRQAGAPVLAVDVIEGASGNG